MADSCHCLAVIAQPIVLKSKVLYKTSTRDRFQAHNTSGWWKRTLLALCFSRVQPWITYRVQDGGHLSHVEDLFNDRVLCHFIFSSHLTFANFSIQWQLPGIFVSWISLKITSYYHSASRLTGTEILRRQRYRVFTWNWTHFKSNCTLF